MSDYDKELVAVYGTLKKGECRHDVLKDADYIGTTLTKENYWMFDTGNFPAVIHDADSDKPLPVEVYEVTQDLLEKLDNIEANGVLFERHLVRLRFQDDLAWLYVYKQPIHDTMAFVPENKWSGVYKVN